MTQERVEVKVMGVFMHQEEKQPTKHFVLYRDDKGRQMPIWVGQFEAWAISYALDGQTPDRPMTQDVTLTMLTAAGAAVVEAAITELRDEMFYSTVTLRLGSGETREIEARPSDAVALALWAKCPIYVTEDVMACVARDDKSDWDETAD